MSRASNMKPGELKAIIREVWGDRAQQTVAADIGVGGVTVSRWLSGHTPIGDVEALLLRLILMLSRDGIDWRRWLRAYVQPGKATMEDLL